MIIIERSLFLRDWNGENLAEFLMLVNGDYKQVKCIPYPGMVLTNINNPIVVQAGMAMPDTSFLGYIANVARVSKDEHSGLVYQMYSTDKSYMHIDLMVGMHASRIAKLTGYDIKMVRDYYRDYFVVDTNATD